MIGRLWGLVTLLLAPLLISGSLARAQSSATSAPAPASNLVSTPQPPYWANRGRWNFGMQLGFALENGIPRNISHISLIIAQPQVGFIVKNFNSRHVPLRRFEIVNEGIFGNAVHPGGRLAGYALLFRFDGKGQGKFVPFFDAGAGVQHTTLHTKAPELSGSLQFSPQGGVGIQYFFMPERALILEYRYMHMSNAGIDPPNYGFNASMLTIGFRWLRRPRPAVYPSYVHHSRNPIRLLFGK